MANENKLIGALQLETKGVMEAIRQVNDALKKLGQGVDLNLTKIINTKVNSQLAELRKEIDSVRKATTGMTGAQQKAANQELAFLEMQARQAREYGQQKQAYEQEQIRLRQQNEQAYTQWWAKALDERDKRELASLEQRAADARRYGAEKKKQAEEEAKIQAWYINDSANRAKQRADQEARITLDSYKKRAAEEEKFEEERARIQSYYDKQSADNRKKAIELEAQVTLNGIKQRAQAEEEARKEAERAQQVTQQAYNQMALRAAATMGRASLQLLREQWSAAVDYATKYYDKLNEIRVVTGKTETEAQKMGDSFRKMAESLKVTSSELASAAVTFYRQGLNDEQVEDRLNWVTKYAKVANLDFEEAAQLITASTNAMSADIQGDVERVVDVFLYLGDAAATSGEEIGKAMQKASASATEFGISFEWLGSYIATVSEQTRQAPESIGNAFNSMMARMHSIKQTGFNSEDATTLNNVAKALAAIDVEMMDKVGNWRDMSDIMADIAGKWSEMTDKERSYIATTVAGVRQQNVFFALMNDMSKGIEGGSRAWELYTGAMQAAGTATAKYSIYQESVAASQADLQNSLEQLYDSFTSGEGMKNVYGFLTG